MERNVEGTCTGLLRQITEKREWNLGDGAWEMPRAEGMREAAGMQLVINYIGIRQATVAQWVEIHPLLEVCAREKGYE